MSSGFVAGTLVHTDKGLIPIQNLQVGDLVVSKTKNGNQYEQIIKIYNNDLQRIYQLIVRQTQNDEFIFTDEALYLTNEQIVVIQKINELNLEKKWVKALNLNDFDVIDTIKDSQICQVQSLKEVFQVKNDIGLCLKIDDYDNDYETYIEYQKSQPLTFAYDLEYPDGYYRETVKLGNLKNLDLNNSNEKQIFDNCFNYLVSRSSDKHMLLPTYSLEIAQSRNYFVGNLGILVGDSTIQGTTE